MSTSWCGRFAAQQAAERAAGGVVQAEEEGLPIRGFLRAFDERESALAAARAGAPTPRIRVTLAENASRWLAGAQVLYRLSDQWQKQIGPEPGASELIVVHERTEAARLRASA